MRYTSLLLIALLGLSLPSFAGSLVFRNFSHSVELLSRGDHFVVAGTDVRVQVANRLIVRVSAAASEDDVRRLYAGAIRVKPLFTGKHSHYYAFELQQDADLQVALDALQRQPAVERVQPDVLQLTARAHSATKGGEARTPPSPDLDALWQRSKGKGVKVAVIDDGFDLGHPRLAHVKLAFAFDMASGQLMAQPETRHDTHGTRVLGVLFASHTDNTLKGIVPEAELIAIRQPDSWTSNTLLAFQLAALAEADVINCSWNTAWLLEPVSDVVQALAAHGRNGKGSAVVFAAGNQGRIIAAHSTEAAIQEAIVVSATDAQGRLLATSNYGDSVDLNVYGVAVDSTSIDGGFARIGGTSLASARVSGLAALLLGSNPEMELADLVNQLKFIAAHPKPEADAEVLHAGI